jgi:DNA-directed RNA polymerase subunit N
MIIPVRCFSCGRPVAQNWEEYVERTGKGEDAGKVMDEFGLRRYCCRRMLVTHSEIIDETMLHKRF